MTVHELANKVLEALNRLEGKGATILLELDVRNAMAVCSLIQLALKHPEVKGKLADRGNAISKVIAGRLAGVEPILGVYLATGYKPSGTVA